MTIDDAEARARAEIPDRPIQAIVEHHFHRPTAAQYMRADPPNGGIKRPGGYRVLRRVRNYHVKTRGWRDIGYNWVFTPDGKIWTGRTLLWAGAHTIGMNSRSIGLGMCLAGDTEPLTDYPAMEDSVVAMTAILCDIFSLTERDVFFHRDFANKSCPGWLLNKGDFQASVADMMREPEAAYVRLKLDDVLHPGRVPLAIDPATNRVEFVEDFYPFIMKDWTTGEVEDIQVTRGTPLRALLEDNGYRIPSHGWHHDHGPAGTVYAYRA